MPISKTKMKKWLVAGAAVFAAQTTASTTTDYAQMRAMFMSAPPGFDAVLDTLDAAERRLNWHQPNPENERASSADLLALVFLAPRPGLEPGTYGLTVRRSTN
jgi:hypothetical protein